LVRTEKKVFFVEDLNLRGLTKRNKAKIDDDGKFLPNGQSAKSYHVRLKTYDKNDAEILKYNDSEDFIS